MKIRDLLQIPFFMKNCIFVPTFPCKEEDILSVEDEIEDIKEFVFTNDISKIKSEKSEAGYFLVPHRKTYVICKVKQKENNYEHVR